MKNQKVGCTEIFSRIMKNFRTTFLFAQVIVLYIAELDESMWYDPSFSTIQNTHFVYLLSMQLLLCHVAAV